MTCSYKTMPASCDYLFLCSQICLMLCSEILLETDVRLMRLLSVTATYFSRLRNMGTRGALFSGSPHQCLPNTPFFVTFSYAGLTLLPIPSEHCPQFS